MKWKIFAAAAFVASAALTVTILHSGSDHKVASQVNEESTNSIQEAPPSAAPSEIAASTFSSRKESEEDPSPNVARTPKYLIPRVTLQEVRNGIEDFPSLLARAKAGDKNSVILLMAVLNSCTFEGSTNSENGECKNVPREMISNRLRVISDLYQINQNLPEAQIAFAKEFLSEASRGMEGLASLNVYTQDQAQRLVENLAGKAIVAGNPEGAVILSRVYAAGTFGFQDRQKSYMYALAAQKLGYEFPVAIKERLEASLTPQQKEQAEQSSETMTKQP